MSENGPSLTEGRVEVFYMGLWGAIFDLDWTPLDASVVCKELGHNPKGNFFLLLILLVDSGFACIQVLYHLLKQNPAIATSFILCSMTVLPVIQVNTAQFSNARTKKRHATPQEELSEVP